MTKTQKNIAKLLRKAGRKVVVIDAEAEQKEKEAVLAEARLKRMRRGISQS